MRTLVVLLLVLAGFLAPTAHRALAEEKLGEPWEPGVLAGVARQQEAQEREGRTPKAILRQAELAAARTSDATTSIVRRYLLARAYGLAGDRGSAASTYREVLGLAPRCYFAYHDLAMLELGKEPPDRNAAVRYLGQAASIHPRYATAHRKLAMLLLEDGKIQQAMFELRRVVDLEPGDLQARFLLAKTLLGLSRLDEAEREIALLIRKAPKPPAFRELKGDLYLARGRYEDALKVYERLSRAHPSAVTPLRRSLQALDELRTKKDQFDPERWLRTLEALHRILEPGEEKTRLGKTIEELRRMEAAPPAVAPEGPPTDDVLVTVLARAGPEDRVKLLRYVYGRAQGPTQPLLKALIGRLGPRAEPSGEVRRWVVHILARYGGFGLVGLLRHSLNDPDAGVRPAAADGLLRLAVTEPAAEGAALLVLGLYVTSPDPVLANAARAGVLTLSDATLAVAGGDAYAPRQDAFREWWHGTAAGEAKIAALETFPRVEDRFPEDVLLPYLRDADSFVAEAAWRALSQEAKRLGAAAGVSASRRQWYATLPPFERGLLRGADGGRTRGQLQAWAARKPRS